MATIRLDDGKDYEVAHEFSPDRMLINYDGLYVLVDRVDSNTFELSGEPARQNERDIVNKFAMSVKDEVIVTKDGS